MSDTEHTAAAHGVRVTITQSAGADGAPVVFIDTDDSLDTSSGPAMRILLNDEPVWLGVPYEPKET